MSVKNDVSILGNVRVNAIAPGWTITPKKIDQGINDDLVEKATATMSLKKLATPEDVANAVVSISSDLISSKYIIANSRLYTRSPITNG